MNIGSVVIALSGRDKGKAFAVIGESDNAFIIANGRARTIECPKKKNKKHVEQSGYSISEEAKAKLNEKTLTNRALYREIKSIIEHST